MQSVVPTLSGKPTLSVVSMPSTQPTLSISTTKPLKVLFIATSEGIKRTQHVAQLVKSNCGSLVDISIVQMVTASDYVVQLKSEADLVHVFGRHMYSEVSSPCRISLARPESQKHTLSNEEDKFLTLDQLLQLRAPTWPIEPTLSVQATLSARSPTKIVLLDSCYEGENPTTMSAVGLPQIVRFQLCPMDVICNLYSCLVGHLVRCNHASLVTCVADVLKDFRIKIDESRLLLQMCMGDNVRLSSQDTQYRKD